MLDLGRSLEDDAALALPAVAGLATGDDPSLESLDAAEERDEVDDLFERPL